MRSVQELLKAYEEASLESPLILAMDESDNFQKAMKMLGESYDKSNSQNKITVWDRGISFKDDAIISPADGRAYSTRHSWDEMLKYNGCIQIGNDFNNATEKKREVQGNFDCREELTRVTHQVAEKYGY